MSVIGYTIWYLIAIFTWGVYMEKTLQLFKKSLPIKQLILLTLGIIPLAWLLESFFIFGIISQNYDSQSLLFASFFAAFFFSHWGVLLRKTIHQSFLQLSQQVRNVFQ